MNIVINKLSLDVNKSGNQANIVAKKGDISSRAVLINFHKNGNIYNVEDGNTAIIRAKKPDGTVIYNNATVEDGKVYFVFTSQYCAAVGKVLLEVQLLDSDNNVLYTPKFVLRVEDNLYNDSEIESTNEYTQLTQSINQAQAAITTAQALSLIKYVTALPTTGNSKYLYILYNTKKLYELSGLPSQFTSAAEYNGWKSYYGDNAKACMFKTTDPDHPFILFYGIELEVETYSNPGMYTLKGIMRNTQAIEYVYNANTKQWVAEAPITGLSVGDNIIKGESYTGSDSAWEGYYVIDDSFETTYAKLYGYLWCIGEFTMVNRLNTVTYTESDNLFNIYDSVDLPLPYGVPYVYDSSFNQYIEVTDADLKNRVAIIENIIEDIDYDINSLETGKQDKLTAGDNITISADNVISATGGGGGTSYTAGSGIDITDNVISIPQIVYRGTWYYDDTLNSKTHTFAQIYAMKDSLTKENFHLYANGPSDEEITCDYFSINPSVLVLQFLYGFNVGATNKLYRIVITHLSDDTVQVGREQLLNYTGLQNGISAGDGISISNGVISVDSNIVQYDYAKFNNMGEIVLPVLVDKNYRQTIDFTCDNYATNNVILGSQYNELMHITQYGNKYYIRKTLSSNAELSLSLTGRHTFIYSPTEYVKFDGDIVISDINFSSFTNAGEHYVLGARNGNGMSAEPNYKYSNIKIHEYTLTDTTDDTILCHLIPAKYELDGVVLSSGLYDTVNKQFYTCNGLTIANN